MLVRRDTLVDQVYVHLLEIIGNMNPEENKLPSEEALSKMLGVSRPTVRDVLKRLSKDGYITTIHGVGTFGHPSLLQVEGRIDTNTDFYVLLKRQHDDVAVQNTQVGIGPASAAFCREFACEQKEVYRMSWTYTASGKPTIVCEYEFPVDNFRVFPALNARYTDLAEFSQHCLYQRIAFCTMRLGAVQSGSIAKQFGIQEDAVLLNIEEKIYDIHDHAVGFASCYIHPENMQLTMAVQFSN